MTPSFSKCLDTVAASPTLQSVRTSSAALPASFTDNTAAMPSQHQIYCFATLPFEPTDNPTQAVVLQLLPTTSITSRPALPGVSPSQPCLKGLIFHLPYTHSSYWRFPHSPNTHPYPFILQVFPCHNQDYPRLKILPRSATALKTGSQRKDLRTYTQTPSWQSVKFGYHNKATRAAIHKKYVASLRDRPF